MRAATRIADVDALAERVLRARGNGAGDAARRLLVALAGPPGAGKSTLAAQLVARLPDAVVVPMDGFHLDDALLEPAGLLPVKGSPPTFDVAGLAVMLERLRRDDAEVLVPLFDRERELSRAAAARVEPRHRIVVVEGNYLLLDRPPWSALADVFDLGVLVDVDAAVLHERLVRRWLDHGFERAAALARAEANDLPNGELVRTASRVPDVLFSPDPPV